MDRDKQEIIEYLLSQKGVKPTNDDFKTLYKYYGYSIGNISVFTDQAKLLRLPTHLIEKGKVCGLWSVSLGDPEGSGRTRLVRNMLRNSFFTEFLLYQELINKDCRKKYVTSMELEVIQTQESFDGFYNGYRKK